MKYRLHKLNMDDIVKIEDKAGLELESGLLEGTFCLVDKEGKVFLDKGNHLLVYKAVGLDITDGNLGVKDGLMEAAQAVAYFKNICDVKVKIPTIREIISEDFDGKIKGLGKIESVDIVQLQYNLNTLDAIKDNIESAFDALKTQMRQVRDLTTPDIATNIINAEYKDVYEDEYEGDDYPEDDEYEDDYEDEDDDYEDDDPEEEDEEERE